MNAQKNSTHLLIASALLLVYVSCNKIEGPVLKPNNHSTDTCVFTDTLPQLQKILLEDYTGHTCGNCPTAADIAKTLSQQYAAQLIVMSIHAGHFAEPTGTGTTMYYDFRTSAGNDWDNKFGISAAGNPNGLVNRTGYPGTQIKGKNEWGTDIAALVNNPASVNIFIVNKYDTVTRKLTTCVKTKFLNTLSSSYKLVVCIKEDSIMQPQIDDRLSGNDTVYTYVHNHVLRGAVTSSWGDDITTVPAGNSAVRSYIFTLHPDWNASHCTVVAFLYDNINYQVIQVGELKIEN